MVSLPFFLREWKVHVVVWNRRLAGSAQAAGLCDIDSNTPHFDAVGCRLRIWIAEVVPGDRRHMSRAMPLMTPSNAIVPSTKACTAQV